MNYKKITAVLCKGNTLPFALGTSSRPVTPKLKEKGKLHAEPATKCYSILQGTFMYKRPSMMHRTATVHKIHLDKGGCVSNNSVLLQIIAYKGPCPTTARFKTPHFTVFRCPLRPAPKAHFYRHCGCCDWCWHVDKAGQQKTGGGKEKKEDSRGQREVPCKKARDTRCEGRVRRQRKSEESEQLTSKQASKKTCAEEIRRLQSLENKS